MGDHDSAVCDGRTISEGKNYIIIKGSFMKLVKLKTQKYEAFDILLFVIVLMELVSLLANVYIKLS